jgi:hypothetical protein
LGGQIFTLCTTAHVEEEGQDLRNPSQIAIWRYCDKKFTLY